MGSRSTEVKFVKGAFQDVFAEFPETLKSQDCVTNGRVQVKVSDRMSQEGQLAMRMARGEIVRHRTRRPSKAGVVSSAIPVRSLARSSSAKNLNSDKTENKQQTETLRFAEALERLCSTRLHGDITDKNFMPKEARKRSLRGGDRFHNALEVVEIVYHCEPGVTKGDGNETDEENAEIQRVASISSFERCQAWVEVHFFDDSSSEGSVDR